jgi:leader peptidase (prepilin peptidase) / N-methyltransferase
MLAFYWIFVVFVIGLVIGSFLNVAIARLPLEKSLIWPGSRCGTCQQPIRWYDNLPLISYLWLRGRCRTCGAAFSVRYLLVELVTGLAFAGLFYVEVVRDVHGWDPMPGPLRAFGYYPWWCWVGFLVHATLMAFLLTASVTDLNGREIPLQLTLTGTALGILFGVLMPWPWPLDAPAVPPPPPGAMLGGLNLLGNGPPALPRGVQVCPLWWPLPDWLAPGNNWQTGLATSLAGALVGTLMMRSIAFLFGAGLRREALGLGDADLMMMVGAFLGWQVVAVALFVSTIPACVFGVIRMVVYRDNSLPFGPSLAAGSMLTLLCWDEMPAGVMLFLFTGPLLAIVVAFAAVFLFVSSFVIRTTRG